MFLLPSVGLGLPFLPVLPVQRRDRAARVLLLPGAVFVSILSDTPRPGVFLFLISNQASLVPRDEQVCSHL